MFCTEYKTMPVVCNGLPNHFENDQNTSNLALNDIDKRGRDNEMKYSYWERKILFLQETHERTIRLLHEEIEYLRAKVTGLQRRLVMCPCTGNAMIQKELDYKLIATGKEDTRELRGEVLINEKNLKNQQNEELVLPNRLPPPPAHLPGPVLDKTYETVDQSGIESLTQPVPSDIDPSEVSDTERIFSPGGFEGEGITSPRLQPDSITAPIVLAPRNTVTSQEGVWVRRSVLEPSKNDVGSLNTSTNACTGQRICPVRLPALRNEKALTYAVVKNTGKNVLTPTLVRSSSNLVENSRFKISRFNSEACVKADRGPIKSHDLSVYKSHEEINLNLTPRPSSQQSTRQSSFLPALTKSDNSTFSVKLRKSRLTQRNRLDRTGN